MKTISAVNHETTPTKPRTNVWPVWAFVCFGCGFISPLLGLTFIIIHSALEHDQNFNQIGTVLMIVSIPMLLAGSHFLDLTEKNK